MLILLKAFDTLKWDFLLWVMHRYCFSSTFCQWISNILSSARISIFHNGSRLVISTALMGFVKGILYHRYCLELIRTSLANILLVW